MPVRAPRICSCGKVVPSGAICPCQAARKRETDKAHDRKRGNSSQRGYNGTWERMAARWKKGKPCAWPGCKMAAAVVDHIIPHKGDPILRDDPNNWQGLCAHHHNSAKQRQDRRRASARTQQ